MSQKMVAVPEEMLIKLEQSRQKIYEILGNDLSTNDLIKWTNVTGVLWELANTRWKEVKETYES